MRVVFDMSVSFFGRAGVRVYTEELAAHLEALGVGIDRARFRPFFTRTHRCLRWMDTIRYEFLWIPWLLRSRRFRRADIVHFTVPRSPAATHHRKVCTLHDTFCYAHPDDYSKWTAFSFRRSTRTALRNSDAILSVSDYVKREALRLFPDTPESRMVTVHNGVSEKFAPASSDVCDAIRKKYGIRKPYVFCLSTNAPNKNFERLFSAIKRIHDRVDVDFVLAGSPGWKTRSLPDLIAEANLGDRVNAIGFVPDEDLPALYSAARLFCYPSLYEGFGLPVLEALKCGAAVLTSRTTALPEVAGDAAVYVDPYSVDSIADGLKRALDNRGESLPSRRMRLEQAERFSWTQTARETRDVYERLLRA